MCTYKLHKYSSANIVMSMQFNGIVFKYKCEYEYNDICFYFSFADSLTIRRVSSVSPPPSLKENRPQQIQQSLQQSVSGHPVDYSRYVKRYNTAMECGSSYCKDHNYRWVMNNDLYRYYSVQLPLIDMKSVRSARYFFQFLVIFNCYCTNMSIRVVSIKR